MAESQLCTVGVNCTFRDRNWFISLLHVENNLATAFCGRTFPYPHLTCIVVLSELHVYFIFEGRIYWERFWHAVLCRPSLLGLFSESCSQNAIETVACKELFIQKENILSVPCLVVPNPFDCLFCGTHISFLIAEKYTGHSFFYMIKVNEAS